MKVKRGDRVIGLWPHKKRKRERKNFLSPPCEDIEKAAIYKPGRESLDFPASRAEKK